MKLSNTGVQDRFYWLEILQRLSNPVLSALNERRLHELMPVEVSPGSNAEHRAKHTHLEALGRLLCGIAPWLELQSDDEAELRTRYAEMAREAIRAAVDPASSDYMNWTEGGQPVVDAAFLAQAILRAPRELWQKLDAQTQEQLGRALESTRVILPVWNNWLLFSATVEAALCMMGRNWDKMRVDYALRQHEQWFHGDGTYGDGPHYVWDYYNSYVIHPMIVDVVRTCADDNLWPAWRETSLKNLRRYAQVQERLISPEGTFPPLGRSLAYRFGALQALSQAALLHNLADDLQPAQVRCALTAVIRRMIEVPGTFDEDGWLRMGFCGSQPEVGEMYISTGSLYLCAAALLPLGLPSTDPFWADAPQPWTAQKMWQTV